MPVEEPVHVLPLEPRGTEVSTEVGVQRLLRAGERCEQIERLLPGALVVPLHRSSSGMRKEAAVVLERESSRRAQGIDGTLTLSRETLTGL